MKKFLLLSLIGLMTLTGTFLGHSTIIPGKIEKKAQDISEIEGFVVATVSKKDTSPYVGMSVKFCWTSPWDREEGQGCNN